MEGLRQQSCHPTASSLASTAKSKSSGATNYYASWQTMPTSKHFLCPSIRSFSNFRMASFSFFFSSSSWSSLSEEELELDSDSTLIPATWLKSFNTAKRELLHKRSQLYLFHLLRSFSCLLLLSLSFFSPPFPSFGFLLPCNVNYTFTIHFPRIGLHKTIWVANIFNWLLQGRCTIHHSFQEISKTEKQTTNGNT